MKKSFLGFLTDLFLACCGTVELLNTLDVNLDLDFELETKFDEASNPRFSPAFAFVFAFFVMEDEKADCLLAPLLKNPVRLFCALWG